MGLDDAFRNIQDVQNRKESRCRHALTSFQLGETVCCKTSFRRNSSLRKVCSEARLSNCLGDSALVHRSPISILYSIQSGYIAQDIKRVKLESMDKTIAAQLKEARKLLGLPQRVISEELGWANISPVGKIERGLQSTSFEALEKWAARLGCSVQLVPFNKENEDDVVELLRTALAIASKEEQLMIKGVIEYAIEKALKNKAIRSAG